MNPKILITKQIMVAVILLFSAAAFVSCEKYSYDPPKADLTTPVSFQTDIIPIFTGNNCTSCHSGGLPLDLRPANAFESLTSRGDINVGSPESSKIYTELNSSPHNTRCSVDDRNKILAWITQGALNN